MLIKTALTAPDYGYCLNPHCRYEPASGLTDVGKFMRREAGGGWL